MSLSSSSNSSAASTSAPVNSGSGSRVLANIPATNEIDELRSRLIAREQQIEMMEASNEQAREEIFLWHAKYERLYEAHRKLQKTNSSLEDKLLRIVDKFDADKNQMTRDLASQTQKLVEAKLTLQQLHDQNQDLQSDLCLSLTCLQNKPNSFMAQRVDTLTRDMQVRVQSYLAGKQRRDKNNEGRRITVAVNPNDEDNNETRSMSAVSAAILAKVLEERAKERRKQTKFCIDVGTQTHGWHFPDKIFQSSSLSPSNKKVKKTFKHVNNSTKTGSSSSPKGVVDDTKLIHVLRSISLDDQRPHSSNILLASVIQRPPPSSGVSRGPLESKSPSYSSIDTIPTTSSESDSLIDDNHSFISSKFFIMGRSATYSAKQTDL